MQNVPILNDHVDMRPILNGNLSIHSIHLKPKKDPFPSKLCSHIPSRMDPSQTPGVLLLALFTCSRIERWVGGQSLVWTKVKLTTSH